MALEGGAVGAAGAAVAAGAFSYNRGNYMYDAGLRFERFSSAREYANQQAEQFRGDIRNLAALTVKKNTVWTVTSTLCMALCVALYCAGRLGLHGPSPPAWIMGLWLTNNAAAFSFMALCIFLALHAAFRAQAASAQLLTRTVRVPVPTLKQLDAARKFASEFEQESWGDIFRLPYISNNGAPKTDDAVYESDGEEEKKGSGRRARSAPPVRSKCSSWVREEFEVDRAGTVTPTGQPANAAPEHFQLYAAVQKEFYQYDMYARVCIFYGFISYFQSLAYYGLGHINIELRAFWVAYATAFVIAVLQALILRFDIIPAHGSRKQFLPRCEFLGPLAILPAAVGMSLDFQVQYDPTAIALCWIMVFIAYILQLIYNLRLLEVVLPDEAFAGLEERLGAAYLPEGWNKVPSAFYHVLYFVAPPTKLQPGQYDIVREIKEGETGAYDEVVGDSPQKSSRASPRASPRGKQVEQDGLAARPTTPFANTQHVQPWKLVAALATVLVAMWVFLITGTLVDVAIGEQALVTAPHWSRPPMTRLSLEPHELGTPLGFPWAAGDKPFLPEQMAWHEEKRHADEYSLGRRLASVPSTPAQTGAGLSAALNSLLSSIPDAAKAAALPGISHSVVWPSFFEPRLVACGTAGRMAALTPRGFGAAATVGRVGEVLAESFKLSGITHMPPLIGATWGPHAGADDGLLLVTRSGDLVACPGPRPAAAGTWACSSAVNHGLPRTLPVSEGSRLQAAAVAMLPGAVGTGGAPRLHVAMALEGEGDLVAIFVQEAESWLPVGEMRVPHSHTAAKTSLAFVGGGDILVSTAGGHVQRRRLSDGAIVGSAEHAVHSDGFAWQGACGLDDHVAHLRLRQASQAWRPEIVTAAIPMENPALFQ
eukprot:CAMPEP_0115250394 /NCGR_PEP_ID=MMETSP0270-20121206/43087_1 /TAXON_ID=71861 /ORGANISM="Scrippsiella trochoidea, Strain CCMP3099" /LENGTH=879 /DNA_ID=CAMNT_0002665773 /DNA_START=36 /DNA_END=2675 /DNA_ORIENTATION=+